MHGLEEKSVFAEPKEFFAMLRKGNKMSLCDLSLFSYFPQSDENLSGRENIIWHAPDVSVEIFSTTLLKESGPDTSRDL